ncbi:hypothetical protein O6H91_04G053100 [Diphasiastrum complanatum]|uniref:Uncharacterized protein n=1 Tax=Diphasiastrum complanatum TaxID=34168 RepID=A0ACC2DX86_DIPCM|nr:hypothetical protein O6H91_04G053100 [Diphasiastrum complanatum]
MWVLGGSTKHKGQFQSRAKARGEERRGEMSAMSASIAAQRALQKQRVRLLYRRSLKNVLSWAMDRDLFYNEATKLREEFEEHKNVNDLPTIDRLLLKGETRLAKLAHPDPYIVPWAPGGSKYARNPAVPPEAMKEAFTIYQ